MDGETGAGMPRPFLWLLSALSFVALVAGGAAADPEVLKGREAFGDWRRDKPGTIRLIGPQDLPRPGAVGDARHLALDAGLQGRARRAAAGWRFAPGAAGFQD